MTPSLQKLMNNWSILRELKAPFYLMGIVNLTPDSFSDGQANFFESSLNTCEQLLADGAHILDLGAESTRPTATPVPLPQELDRLLPSLKTIRAALPQAIISVDTYKAAVAQQVLELKLAQIINDVYVNDPAMTEILAQYQPGYVLTHSLPLTGSPIQQQLHFFESKLQELTQAGLAESQIILDPGLGFAKTREQNLEILKSAHHLQTLGRPVLIGLSRKSMFTHTTNPKERDPLTQVATALLASRGLLYHRVHNVRACYEALEFMLAIQ